MSGISRRLVSYRCLGEMMPIYAVYALLFADTGLSGAQISSLFVLWSVAGILFEVPSGALADVLSRRKLLCTGAMFRASGFGLWVLLPSYPAFAAGFVLWAAGSALRSGTLQALVHDELAAIGQESQYQRLFARAEAVALVATNAGMALATPLLLLGGYRAVGLVTVVIAVAAGLVALTFPERPRVTPVGGPPDDESDSSGESGEPTGLRAWSGMLRAGVAEVTTTPPVRRVALLAALLPGLSALDEFFPLLAEHDGATTAMIPLLMVAVTVVTVLGSASASRELPGRVVGLGTAAGGLAMVLGALSGSLWGFAAIAVGYGALQHAMVVVDARLQQAVTGPARATVTSVAGLGSEFGAIGLFLFWGATVAPFGDHVAVALASVPAVVVGLVIAVWLARPARQDPQFASRSSS